MLILLALEGGVVLVLLFRILIAVEANLDAVRPVDVVSSLLEAQRRREAGRGS